MNHAGDYGLWGRACFDPMTAMAGAGVAGGMVQAVGQIRAGQAANAVGKYNGDEADRAALATQQAGAAQSGMLYEDSRRKLATATAGASANGQDAAQGSALDLLAEHAGMAKLDEEMIRWNAAQKSRSLVQQGVLERYQGKQAMKSANIQAAGTLLSTAARAGASFGGGGGGGTPAQAPSSVNIALKPGA